MIKRYDQEIRSKDMIKRSRDCCSYKIRFKVRFKEKECVKE